MVIDLDGKQDLEFFSPDETIISIGKIAEESPDEVKTSHVNLE
jgi:hypothetical protein